MTVDLAPRPLLLLTAALPGTGGLLKVAPEDFEVEERPAYLPGGEGEHLYLWIEKQGLSTAAVARLLAQAAGVNERAVGYAGQKDKRALTRQWFSVQTKEDGLSLDTPGLRILESARHRNRLRLGHLRGNRFRILLRGVVPEAEERAKAILAALHLHGLPNYYGDQRFGQHGDNALLGASLLGLCDHPLRRRAQTDRHLRRLSLSALQSELFNRCLSRRLQDKTWDRPIPGDVLRKRQSGGLFVCESPEEDVPRLREGELDVTGPLPGHKERPGAQRDALEMEEKILREAGVGRQALALGRAETEGTRRPYRVPLENASVDATGPNLLRLSFDLPSGSYATRVLAEITKAAVALPSE